MPSSTSSSDRRFVAAFALTFLVLAASWEGVLRRRAGATVDLAIPRPPMSQARAVDGQHWVILGNCLMMTGVSPRQLSEQLGGERQREIINIATHEQSPIAFFEYLRRSERYPDVVVANVSSWINGTNFEQETALVMTSDPLGFRRGVEVPDAVAQKKTDHGYRQDGDLGAGHLQRAAEGALSAAAGAHVRALGHRYHLFDYVLFAGTLASTANLDDALYQLNMQSWFRVSGSETDGLGYVGLQVQYRDDWAVGLERMAERSLQRMRISRLLTSRYWALLEEDIRQLQLHGTRVVLVRLPEHPKIREFNDRTYDLPERLRDIEQRTGAPVLDLSRLGPAEGVQLFDGVHPDARAAQVITRELATWLNSRLSTLGGATGSAPPGGG